MRKPCIDCTIKHLGTAAVFEEEVARGYPNFEIFLVGNLEHASEEIAGLIPDLANVIREHRIARQVKGQKHRIPYEELYEYLSIVKSLMESSPEGDDDELVPAVPKGCLTGLTEVDEDGKESLELTGDTRP